jgi:alanine racemase
VSRWAWVEIDPVAITHNTEHLRRVVAPSALWAVVKADGYGHGAVTAARAAIAGGAGGLCVALVQEGLELRSAAIDVPVLVLSEQPPEQLEAAVRAGLQLTVYSHRQLDALRACGAVDHPVHLKVDTGMRRVGAAPDDVPGLAEAIAASPATRLAGVYTHLAVADEPDDPYTDAQLDAFDDVLARLRTAGHDPGLVHAANSAGGLAHPRSRYDLVRGGIAVYGISPGPAVDGLCSGLRPALSLHARVSHVKRVRAGDRISYGLRHRFAADANVATLPIGYADGVPRRSAAVGCHVLLGGVPRPIVGNVTMDQLMLDCGDDEVSVGDEAVLIGRQGDHLLRAEDWAAPLDTIGYEIVCGLSQRIERRSR